MPAAIELPALLSQSLVAYTIELDNEFEHLMPHRTTHSMPGSAAGDPWLVSMVMWCNCMRFLRPEGLSVGELEGLARTSTNLAGMQRWGYLVVERPRSEEGVRTAASELRVRPTAMGRQAQFTWRPLQEMIEHRWRERFGGETVDRLRSCLAAVAAKIELELPDCLPILRHGWVTTIADRNGRASRSRSELGLSALLSRALLAFALPFDRRAGLSIAISANLVRVLGSDFIRVRDVHRLAGLATEATRNALGYLDKLACVEFKTDVSAGRGHLVRLSEKGLKAQNTYQRLSAGIEMRWREGFGTEVVDELRETLERLVIPVGSSRPPLFGGLEPYPDGWRAAARIERLPHYPVVLHRGGFPDGS
ncbi:MAG TPA: hypothetical protein VGF93_04685 [Solirubrobacteraceae bacterium]|jgi:hypothetical protein